MNLPLAAKFGVEAANLHFPPTLVHLQYMPRHERVHGHEVKKQQFTNNCFGCGPANEAGLRLKFVLDKKRERFVCRFRLQRRFVGPPAHAHGGIIATILDEAMGKVSKLHNLIALTSRMEITYLTASAAVQSAHRRRLGGAACAAANIIVRPRFAIAKARCWPSSKGTFIEIDPHRMFANYLKKKHSDAT